MKSIRSIFAILILFFVQDACAQRPLKILFMLHNFPTLSATFVTGQITGLIDNGHDVSIFACSRANEKKIHADIEHYNLLERTYFKYLPEDVLSYDILYCQFYSLAKKLLPQVVRLKKLSQKCPKFVVCCRGSDGIEDVTTNNKVDGQLFRHVDLFLTVCEHFKKCLLRAGCNSRKIRVHHSAIDLNRFQFKNRKLSKPDEEITLISIGRLVQKKGFEYSIRAFAQLETEFPHARYVIVGDGPLRKKLQQQINEYGLTTKIKLLGWCSRQEVIKWLNVADIFVHPAITSSGNCQEGIPNVLMEAMAMGLPVVSTYHGGIPELIKDGVSGFLIPEKSIKELGIKIRYLINHSQLWSSLTLAGKGYIDQEHNIEVANNRLITIFLQLLDKSIFWK